MIGHDAASAAAECVIMFFVYIRGGGVCMGQLLKTLRSHKQILIIVLELEVISSYHHVIIIIILTNEQTTDLRNQDATE